MAEPSPEARIPLSIHFQSGRLYLGSLIFCAAVKSPILSTIAAMVTIANGMTARQSKASEIFFGIGSWKNGELLNSANAALSKIPRQADRM